MTTEQKRARARELRHDHEKSIREIADDLGVSVGTAHRYVNEKAAARYRKSTADWKRRQREEQS